MLEKRFYRSVRFVSMLLCFVSTMYLLGCGGGAVIPQSIAGPGSAIGPQENPDNNLFIMPPGHPNRIVFESDKDSMKIYAMNMDGSKITVVADKPSSSDTISAPHTERVMKYSTPAVTSDGYKVYFANDYFATATSILSTSITGGAQKLFKRYGEIYLEDPAVSWDGKKLAFVGYTSTPVTVAVPNDEIIVDMKSPASFIAEFKAAAQFALHPAGYKITTSVYKENATMGILEYQVANPTSCPAPGEMYMPTGGSAQIAATYVEQVEFAGDKKVKYTNPVGKFLCINLDDTNFILLEVVDFLYPITKDLKKSCTQSADCAGKNVDCSNSGRCIDKNGNITYEQCSGSGDCETALCNTEMLCALNVESALASITIDWKWIQKDYTDTTTLTEKFDEDDKEGWIRWGAGMNFIGKFNNKRMDLYTMDLDGTNFVQQTDDLDADRYPCFSPASSNYVYFTKSVLDEGTQNVDKPVSSAIKKLNISTGEIETVLSPSYLVKECAFSPSGTSFVYSAYNGTNFDLHSYNLSSETSSFFVDTGGNDVSPTFSPDGKYVAFQSDYTGDEDIYVTDIGVTNTVNITASRGTVLINDTNPAWTP